MNKMKMPTKFLSILAVASLALFLGNCGDDSTSEAPEKTEFNKLKGTWNRVSVSLSTITGDPTQIDSDFSLTIGGSYNSNSPEGPYTYSVSGTSAPSPWPASGTWTFAAEPDKNEGLLLRDDGVVMSYTLNNGQLTIKFTCTTCDYAGAARTSQVSGNWEFVLD